RLQYHRGRSVVERSGVVAEQARRHKLSERVALMLVDLPRAEVLSDTEKEGEGDDPETRAALEQNSLALHDAADVDDQNRQDDLDDRQSLGPDPGAKNADGSQ